MASALHTVEATGFGRFMREALYAYPIAETIHIWGLALLFGSIALVDLRLLGLGRRMPIALLAHYAVPWTLLGFLIAALSGLAMFTAHAAEFMVQPVFMLKMGLILAGGVNAAVLHMGGWVDLSKSIYMGGQVAWVSHIVGGAFFGFGMTLASGCGSKTLIRIGGGNLKSLIVLIVMGIAAYMTLKGVFASWRAAGLDPWRIDFASFGGKTSDLPSLVGAAGLGATARWLVPALVAGAVAWFVFADRDFRDAREMIVGGVIVGAVVVAGWYVAAHLGYLA